MKTNVALFTPLSKQTVHNLTKEVKKTLATFVSPGNKSFTAADLWSIRKKRRTALLRRSFV